MFWPSDNVSKHCTAFKMQKTIGKQWGWAPELNSTLDAKSYKTFVGKPIVWWTVLNVDNAQMYVCLLSKPKYLSIPNWKTFWQRIIIWESGWRLYNDGLFPIKYDFGYLKVLIKEVDHRHLHHHLHYTTSSFLPFFP